MPASDAHAHRSHVHDDRRSSDPSAEGPGAAARRRIPWEPRPAGSIDLLWRSSRNPIIPRDLLPRSNSIFNSAVVPFDGGFAGVFRVDDRSREMNLHAGRSVDGIDWTSTRRRSPSARPTAACRDPGAVPARLRPAGHLARGSLVRDLVQRLPRPDDRHRRTRTTSRTFHQLDNAFLPFNRNGVLFPRRIGDRYLMLSRPSDNGHTPFGDIFLSESPDLVHWGRHRHVMSPEPWTWQSTKIGAGPTPDRDAPRAGCSSTTAS